MRVGFTKYKFEVIGEGRWTLRNDAKHKYNLAIQR